MGFGRGKGGDDCDGLFIMGGGVCCVLSIIMAIILIACSLEQIEDTSVGIPYNVVEARLSDSVTEGGLHGKPPFGKFIIWPKTHQTLSQKLTCLSLDGVVIDVQVAFQYTPNTDKVYDLTLSYQDFDYYSSVLRLMSRSGIRNACAKFTAQEYQTKRASVQTQMFTDVKARLTAAQMHSVILDLQLTSIDRPRAYEEAVDAKESARNEIDRVKNLEAQELTKANTNLLKTSVQANKTIDTANTIATITANQAKADGDVVYGKYASQGALYKKVRSEHGFSSEGLLQYISVRLVDELNNLTVGLDRPAQMSYSASMGNAVSYGSASYGSSGRRTLALEYIPSEGVFDAFTAEAEVVSPKKSAQATYHVSQSSAA